MESVERFALSRRVHRNEKEFELMRKFDACEARNLSRPHFIASCHELAKASKRVALYTAFFLQSPFSLSPSPPLPASLRLFAKLK